MTVNPGENLDDRESATLLEPNSANTTNGFQGLGKITNWFTSINFRSIQTDTFAKHTPDTGIWFFNHPEFHAWLSKDSGLLWIKGPRESFSAL